jgi:phage portal protein BeeE
MALLEVLEYNARAICSVFGVQPWLVNVPTTDGLTYSTAQAQMGALLSLCLDPVLAKLEGTLSYKFLPGDRSLRFNRDRFTINTATERMQAHAIAIGAGIYSADEARAMENLPARETAVGADLMEVTE